MACQRFSGHPVQRYTRQYRNVTSEYTPASRNKHATPVRNAQPRRPASHLFLAAIGAHLSVSVSASVCGFFAWRRRWRWRRRRTAQRDRREDTCSATRSSNRPRRVHRRNWQPSGPKYPFLSARPPRYRLPVIASLARSILIALQARMRIAIRVEPQIRLGRLADRRRSISIIISH